MHFGTMFVSVVLLGCPWLIPLSSVAQEVVFVVRHSDPPPMLRIDEIREDTPLSESGRQRAQALAGRLRDAGISAIYTPEALRTIQTAEPLADVLRIKGEVHLGDDVDGLIADIKANHPAERVLIVGHWSTIPSIVKALGASEEVKIERSEFDNLFVVLPHDQQAPTLLHLHY